MIVVALVVTVILLVYVVPQFEAVFKDFGAELPAMTQFVVTLSEIVQAYFYMLQPRFCRCLAV